MFIVDEGVMASAETITNKALHDLLDGHLKVKYAALDDPDVSRYKQILNEALAAFSKKEYDHFVVNQKMTFSSTDNLILIPYLIWTSTTEDYDKEKCGKFGYRDYINKRYCTWTRAQAFLLVFDKRNREVAYFKYNQWDIETIYPPDEERITRFFRHCSQPLLRRLG